MDEEDKGSGNLPSPIPGRKKMRDIYASRGIDMSTAVDHNSIMESPAKDSPVLTDSTNEQDTGNYN